jgi:hypothetical protein
MASTKLKGKKSPPQKPLLQVRTITLSPDDQVTLDRLSKDVSDYTGRTISGSAIVRVLIRHTGFQPYDWVLSQLAPIVEEEMIAGVQWGRQK